MKRGREGQSEGLRYSRKKKIPSFSEAVERE